MKLAVVGKGGSGKTVLVTLLARVLAEQGLMVLAADLDTNPGLAVSLGVPPADIPLPSEAVEPQTGTPYGWGLAKNLSPAEALRRYGTPVSDKVVYLGYGNIASLDIQVHKYLTAVRDVVHQFNEPGWVVIADIASGPTNLYEGYARFASLVLVTLQPTPPSVMTAGRLLAILDHDETPAKVVVMQARSQEDLGDVARSLSVFAAVPFDAEVQHLSRLGPLSGLSIDNSALAAVRTLTAKIQDCPDYT